METWLRILYYIVFILGIPIGLIRYWLTKRKEQRGRDDATFDALDHKFMEFQRLCLDFPELDIFDVPDKNAKDKNEFQRKQELIAFTFLFSIFERAHRTYKDVSKKSKKIEWTGWQEYIQQFCVRENFLNAWKESGRTFNSDFQNYMQNLLADTLVREIKDVKSTEFNSFIKLYINSFPEGERETTEALSDWILRSSKGELYPDNYHMLVISLKQSNKIEAGALCHYISALNGGFLGYLVVEPNIRNIGLGQILFNGVIKVIEMDSKRNRQGVPLGIFAEIDKAQDNTQDILRRLQFWRKCNMLPLDIEWKYPRLHTGEGPLNMYLAFCPYRNRPDYLTEKKAELAVRSIYDSVYRKKEDDQNLIEVIKSVTGKKIVRRF